MDINQTRKGESAPTPNNTPRNAAPIQNQPKGQQQQQNQGGKQKGQGNQQQQQQQQNQQQQKGQGSQQQNQQQQNQQQNQGGKQKGQGNQQQNQPQQQQQQKGQGSQQQNQPQQQQKGQQQQQQQSQPQQQQQGQQGGKKNKGGNNNAVVKVEEESQPTFKVELPGGGDLSQNPFLASLLESKLSSMLGHSSGYVESLSPEVQRRVKALKNVQDSHAKLEADFREEVLALEAKYLALKKPLYQKRKSIVNGNVEPTDEECEREDSDMEDDFANRLTIEDEEEEEEEEEPEEEKSGKKAGKKGQQQVAKPKGKKEKPKVKGIPEFWLTTIKNHPLIGETIMEYDDAVLVHLIDVTLSYAEDNHSFSIEFEFEDNEYFTNKTLTKTYFLQNNVDSAYDDLVYSKAEGCKIDWKQDKDVTVRVETKKQKNKASKKIRVVKTLVPQDSFFRFFSPPEAPGHKGGDDDEEEEGEEDDEFISPELEDEIERDFEFGEVFKTKLIPDAIHWFTGQALQYEDDYMEDEEDYDEEDEEEEEEDEDDDDDEEEDDNDDDDGARGHARGGRGGAGAGARGGARGGKGMGAGAQKAGEKPAECNQQ